MNKIFLSQLISVCIVVCVCVVPTTRGDGFGDSYKLSQASPSEGQESPPILNGKRKKHDYSFKKKPKRQDAHRHQSDEAVRGDRQYGDHERDERNSKVGSDSDVLRPSWNGGSVDDVTSHSYRYPPPPVNDSELNQRSNFNNFRNDTFGFSLARLRENFPRSRNLNLHGSRGQSAIPQEGDESYVSAHSVPRQNYYFIGSRSFSNPDQIPSESSLNQPQSSSERPKSSPKRPLSGQRYLDDLPDRISGHQERVLDKVPLPEKLVGEKRPNIILMVTDDLDIELGSLNYMPRLLQVMGGQGALFPNAYTTTPMCCPSRSSMLTGMYIHNHQVFTNHQNCSSPQWQNTHERRTFASYLSNAGYRTGYFGKYLNRYNGSHVPPGWHDWAGLIMNSRYYNYTVNRNNRHVKYGNRYPQDYYPHVITKDGINFLKDSQTKHQKDPYLLVLSYPSPHGPEDSAPEHAHKYFNATDHHTASYNYAPNPDKQWVLQFTDRMPDIQLKFTDLLMTKRLQTLQTIDEAVERLVNVLEDLGEANNTYLFFTSDHGYHLGQYGLTKGKAMPFEFDIKVPFLVRGPGIQAGIELPQIALNVDIAPTFLDIAGLPRPPQMDGRSLLPLLKRSSKVADEVKKVPWRDSFLIESSGRVREEEVLERQEQRMWERERALSLTLQKAASSMNSSGLMEGNGINLYTSKHERLEEVCKGGEFNYPCEPTQKWHCVKIGDRWKMKKCRHKSSSPMWQKHCICQYHEGYGTYGKLGAIERRKQKNFLKKYASKDLHSYGSKFIKSFNNVDLALSTVPKPSKYHHRNRKRKARRKRRYRRSVDEEDDWFREEENSGYPPDDVLPENHEGIEAKPASTSSHFGQIDKDDLDNFESSETELENEFPQANSDVDLKLNGKLTDQSVQAFVEEEELKDLENQIFEITDELFNLESETSTEIPLETDNISATTRKSVFLGCQSNMGHVDCQNEVYVNISAWKNSKAETEDQIKRLRQQLLGMKNILRHLQTKKPKKVNINFDSSTADTFKEKTKFEDSALDQSQTDTIRAINYDQDSVRKNSFKDDINGEINEGGRSAVDDFYYGNEENETLESDLYKENIEDLPLRPKNSDMDDDTNKYSASYDDTIFQHKFIDKKLTLPEVSLEIPIIEDVNFSKKSKSNRNKNRKNFGTRIKENGENSDLYFDNYDYDDKVDKEAFDIYNGELYPIHLNELDDQLASTVKEPSHKICWCNRRIMKKMEIKETRERRRQERLEIKKKRQRKNFKRKHKKKEKAISCNYPKLNCYTHTNDHWKTPPLWTDGNFCFCINSANNTYWCLRSINETHNYLYCEFITGLITYYDLHIDPYQLRNVAFTLSNNKVVELHEKLNSLRSCKGAEECDGFAPRKAKAKQSEKNKLKNNVSIEVNTSKSGKVKSSHGFDLSVPSKKNKHFKIQERNRFKKDKKSGKKFGNEISVFDEDPFLLSLGLTQNIRLPRKSRHRKEKKRQKRKENKKMRRKLKEQRRKIALLSKE